MLARHAVDAIRIDGKLDEASWALAPHVGEIGLIDDPTRRPKFPTEATVIWDDAHLYVAFACTDREPWARMKNRDDRLWEEEVVEVFLDPDGDGQNYAELEVSPHNVVVDLLIPRPRSGVNNAIRWDIAGLQTSTGSQSRRGGPAQADRIAALVAEQKNASAKRKAQIDARLKELRADDGPNAVSTIESDSGIFSSWTCGSNMRVCADA